MQRKAANKGIYIYVYIERKVRNKPAEERANAEAETRRKMKPSFFTNGNKPIFFSFQFFSMKKQSFMKVFDMTLSKKRSICVWYITIYNL